MSELLIEPAYAVYGTYISLLQDMNFNSRSGLLSVNIRTGLGTTIHKLKTRRVFHKPKYDWLRNEQLLEYLKSKDFDTFMVGYQILEEEGIV